MKESSDTAHGTSSDKRSRKIILWVNEIERARYLINAAQSNLTPADLGRHRLCRGPAAERTMGGDAGSFKRQTGMRIRELGDKPVCQRGNNQDASR